MKGVPRADGTKYDSACSGALIRPQWIATAGHCFHDEHRVRVAGKPRYDRTIATFGRATLDGPGGFDLDVVWVEQSPVNDFAIAKLAEPVSEIRVPPLLIPPLDVPVGLEVDMAGWGATKAAVTGPQDRSNRLQHGRWKIVAAEGEDLLARAAGPEATTSACPYDSGAPYFTSWGRHLALVGVESDGPPCPHMGLERVARADHLRDWIREHATW
ncbi:hypothetical protein GCM10012275_04180 [Longimycelium tulufanense]|uniref:Peptidase S1 domain-containing protein n=2 Tax=Longimycelium tulufanense TaxID=907463 RepID=A0A8J3FUL2_9PSEU|nr:hypothetical protein GCM10012275_04180 [Longimycelium tulufanense]